MSSRCTSNIWYHFCKVEGKGKCLYCKRLISMAGGSSTSNLRRHLKFKHPSVPMSQEDLLKVETVERSRSPLPTTITLNDDCDNNEEGSISSRTEQSRLKFINLIPVLGPSQSTLSGSELSSPISETALNHSPQTMDVDVTKPAPFNNKVDIQLLRLICKDYHPFSIVENEEFKNLVKLLNPNYSLPNRNELANFLLPSVYNDISEVMSKLLIDIPEVCLTCEGWSNINNSNYYALTVHYLDEKTRLKSFLLECSEFGDKQKCTGLRISEWINTVLKKFNIHHNICAIVTDNTSSIKSAVEILKFNSVTCFAHSLNSTIKNAINNNIKNLIEKGRTIVQYFTSDSRAGFKFEEMQNKLNQTTVKLKPDVPTRWNSTFDMLHSIFHNKAAIISTLTLLEQDNTFKTEDWDLVEHCINMLQVFYEITAEISSENTVFLSKTSVFYRIMVKKVNLYLENKSVPNIIRKLGESLVKGLVNTFGDMERNDIISESILLDPRFKKEGFEDEAAFHSTYESLLTKITGTIKQEPELLQNQSLKLESSTSSIWDEFDATISQLQETHNPSHAIVIELEKYLSEIHISRTNDPLVWWEARKMLYPNLYKIMISRLCIPATSVPPKMIFTKEGQILVQKRWRLTSKKVNQILIVNNNIDLL